MFFIVVNFTKLNCCKSWLYLRLCLWIYVEENKRILFTFSFFFYVLQISRLVMEWNDVWHGLNGSQRRMLRHSGFSAQSPRGFSYISGIFPCIYTYTRKQIKVIFHLNPSQQDMIFPFNDTVCTSVVRARKQRVCVTFGFVIIFRSFCY